MQNILMVSGSPLTLIKEGTFRFVEQVNEERNIRYGSAISSYLTAESYYPSGSITPEVAIGDEITYYQRVDVDSDFDPINNPFNIKIGVFTVTDVKKINNSLYRFEAYDNIYKLNVDFSSTLYSMKNQFPMTVKNFLDAVNNAVSGVTIHLSSLRMYSATGATIDYFYVNGITVKDILEYVAELEAKYVYAWSNGTISFRGFNSLPHFLPDEYWLGKYIIAPTDQVTYTDGQGNNLVPIYYKQDGLKKSDYYFKELEAYIVRRASGGYTYGYAEVQNPQNIYLITSNVIADNITATEETWEDICDSGYNTFYNLLYLYHLYPMEIHLFPFRNPFRAGSFINYIEGTDGVRFSSIVMKMEVTDAEAVIYCFGDEMYQTQNEDYNPMEDKVISINTRLNQVEAAKVSKSGDTMSGSLTVNSLVRVIRPSNAGNGVALDSSDADSTVTLQSDTNLLPIALRDKNGVNVGVVRGRLDTNGNKGIYLYGSNGSVNNYLRLLIDANGNKTVELNAKDEWLAALGLDHIPYMLHIGSVSNGSSKTFTFTGNVTMIIQVSSGNTGRNGLYVVYGRTSSCVVEAVLASSTATFDTSTNGKIVFTASSTLILNCIITSGYGNVTVT